MNNHPLEFVSLNNVCLAFLERRKASLTAFPVQLSPFTVKKYWRDDPQGKIPCIADIYKTYSEALELGIPLPEEIKELYQCTIKKNSSGRGRPKESASEHAVRGMYAITLSAIAEFEKSTKANFFPIKNHDDARRVFYRQILNTEFTESKNGGRDPYYMALGAGKSKKEIDLICSLLKNLYIKNALPQGKTLPMPTPETIAHWGYDLLTRKAWIGNIWKSIE